MIYHDINGYLNDLLRKIYYETETDIRPSFKINFLYKKGFLKICFSKKYKLYIYSNYFIKDDFINKEKNDFCCKLCSRIRKNLYIFCINENINYSVIDKNYIVFCKHFDIIRYILYEYNYFVNLLDSSDSYSSNSFY